VNWLIDSDKINARVRRDLTKCYVYATYPTLSLQSQLACQDNKKASSSSFGNRRRQWLARKSFELFRIDQYISPFCLSLT